MTKPNIIYIVSDDQPNGLMDAMPFVRTEVKDKGLNFSNSLAPTALCSPARSNILTGNLSNKTGVWTNEIGPGGAWPAFGDRENDTIATRLKGQGYHTACLGKYLNKFSMAPDGYIPPGWDDFIIMYAGKAGVGAGAYYEYTLKGSIYPEYHGNNPEDYSTDVIRDKAVEVINNTPADEPLFLYFAPWGPHANYEAAPRHKGTWLDDGGIPKSFNEQNMSDKPQWMQDLPEADLATETEHLREMHEAVMSIDEAVEAIFTAMGDRMDNCVVVYMSDNGKMLGSHRAVKKDLPHKLAAEIPIFVRWDGVIEPGTKTTRVTPNIDITALVADAAGVTDWDIDGKSPLATGRLGIAMQQKDNYEDQEHPGYIGYRSERYLYVCYTNGMGEEFYDYDNDPHELRNAIDSDDPEIKDQIAWHRQRARNNTPYPPDFIL